LKTKRLATLIGVAGMGKTRLALEIGKAALDQFADGVWLVELAPLADGALVAQMVSAVLGLPERPSQQPLDVLTTFIADKHMLVILDNCEHMIEASARIADALLRACPRLHILATSREALRIPGEMIWRVPPLVTPDPLAALLLDRAGDYDAVQLFVEHATLAQPSFVLTKDNLATVAQICHRLDGMPLAIEMAAAQIADLGLAGIAAGLDDRFALLTSGSRTAVPHQQTLRATLDWSYNLLAEPARALLARLSVFAGGWTAGAAQAICESTHHGLLQLARKSLVMTVVNEHERDSQPRYRLLETIRDYAAEKLRERGEREATLDRHLAYFLDMAEEPIELAGPRVDAWVRRMDPEYDNVRAAFTWSMTCDDEGEKALRLVYGMATYAWRRGHYVEIENWVEQAQSRGNKAPAFARARALKAKASILNCLGSTAHALWHAEESLALFRQTDDRLGLAWCLEMLANNLHNDQAQMRAKEALLLFRELGSQDGQGRALRALGGAFLRAGDRAKATRLLEQSIEVARWDAWECMNCLYDANPQRALELCAQEHVYWIQTGDLENVAYSLLAYGAILMVSGGLSTGKESV